tara:strand:+ start:239 stop:784 length:546 start_codon:yes stop_codon:yes gene_type:complete
MKNKYEEMGYTAFDTPETGHVTTHDERFKDVNVTGYDLKNSSAPAFFTLANAGWVHPEDTGWSGWKVVRNENDQPRMSCIYETSWWHSIEPSPQKFVGGPFRAAVADFTLGMSALFYKHKFCPMTSMHVTYDKPVEIGQVLETLQDTVAVEDNILTQTAIQRVFETDEIVGHVTVTQVIPK